VTTTTIAWVRSVRIDDDGLTVYADIHSSLGPEVTSREMHGFDVEAPAADLEAAVLARVETVCRDELGIPVDADHAVRVLTRLR
jgi:hypothetical protein